MGRDLAVNGNFSFRPSGKKMLPFRRWISLYFFSPWPQCLTSKMVKAASVCVCVCAGNWQKGRGVENDCYHREVLLLQPAAALFMKCHNKSELTPVCSYRARFLGARWVLCDCVSVDYFISYIWDSKWLPRTPQEGGTPSQLGNLPSPETPESRGDKASSSKQNLKVHTHQGHGGHFYNPAQGRNKQ